MNLNLGLSNSPTVETTSDPIQALRDMHTACATLEALLIGYENTGVLLKLKKAGKLTSDMVAFVGVENMRAVEALDKENASTKEDSGTKVPSGRWEKIKAAAIAAWRAIVKFFASMIARFKKIGNSILARIKRSKKGDTPLSKIVEGSSGESYGSVEDSSEKNMVVFEFDIRATDAYTHAMEEYLSVCGRVYNDILNDVPGASKQLGNKITSERDGTSLKVRCGKDTFVVGTDMSIAHINTSLSKFYDNNCHIHINQTSLSGSFERLLNRAAHSRIFSSREELYADVMNFMSSIHASTSVVRTIMLLVNTNASMVERLLTYIERNNK